MGIKERSKWADPSQGSERKDHPRRITCMSITCFPPCLGLLVCHVPTSFAFVVFYLRNNQPHKKYSHPTIMPWGKRFSPKKSKESLKYKPLFLWELSYVYVTLSACNDYLSGSTTSATNSPSSITNSDSTVTLKTEPNVTSQYPGQTIVSVSQVKIEKW